MKQEAMKLFAEQLQNDQKADQKCRKVNNRKSEHISRVCMHMMPDFE